VLAVLADQLRLITVATHQQTLLQAHQSLTLGAVVEQMLVRAALMRVRLQARLSRALLEQPTSGAVVVAVVFAAIRFLKFRAGVREVAAL
jgi:hypothetical protein